MQRNSFIFYRSFFEATKPLSQEQKAQLFDAICKYSLDQEEINLDPICAAMFSLIRPQLEANYRKFVNGCKTKQVISKKEAPKKQTASKAQGNVNVNDNVNVNVNVKEKDVYIKFAHLQISNHDFKELQNLGYTKKEINDILDNIKNYKKNHNYKSLFLTAKNWLNNDKAKNGIKNARPSDFDPGRTFGVTL
tara:strand:+ start:2347 stop:2922 length:576 start_codon:yes stop_codon:yes gene_type:complete